MLVDFPITVNKAKSRNEEERGVQTCGFDERRPAVCSRAHNKLMGPTMRVRRVDLHRLIARAL